MSRIRGGHNFAQIRIRDTPVIDRPIDFRKRRKLLTEFK